MLTRRACDSPHGGQTWHARNRTASVCGCTRVNGQNDIFLSFTHCHPCQSHRHGPLSSHLSAKQCCLLRTHDQNWTLVGRWLDARACRDCVCMKYSTLLLCFFHCWTRAQRAELRSCPTVASFTTNLHALFSSFTVLITVTVLLTGTHCVAKVSPRPMVIPLWPCHPRPCSTAASAAPDLAHAELISLPPHLRNTLSEKTRLSIGLSGANRACMSSWEAHAIMTQLHTLNSTLQTLKASCVIAP